MMSQSQLSQSKESGLSHLIRLTLSFPLFKYHSLGYQALDFVNIFIDKLVLIDCILHTKRVGIMFISFARRFYRLQNIEQTVQYLVHLFMQLTVKKKLAFIAKPTLRDAFAQQ